MKAKFNYDLTEVLALMERTQVTVGIFSNRESQSDRAELLRRAESLVQQMEERAHQAAQSQTSLLDGEKARRLLRKI